MNKISKLINKSIITIALIAATYLSMAAASEKPYDAITVNFKEYTENPEFAGILKALDASQVTATLYADSLDATHYEIWMVECSGRENKRTKIGYKLIEPDSTKITFTAVPKDSINVSFSFMRISSGAPRMTASIATDNHILIGCDYGWEFNQNDTIPLVEYSDGIHKEFDFGNGQILEGLDICGLRFSKVNPLKWKEDYGLSDYLYFEAIPVKEMLF
ncbi:MAG: hypothetical protein K2L11_07160 [Muribaculaceae bacterium]|nr:hypothetical protein [Muribaculaceae bacterium]